MISRAKDRIVKAVAWSAALLALATAFAAASPVGAGPLQENTPPRDRWIGVKLDHLTVTAYQGTNPVYTASFSGGRPGWETPIGSFRILRRIASDVLDSASFGLPRDRPGGYCLPDVRYVQYITDDGIALHEDYWSSDWVFGRQNTTYGCVSLRNGDAAFFWDFATLGTPVVIHRLEDLQDWFAAAARTRTTRGGFSIGANGMGSDSTRPWSATRAAEADGPGGGVAGAGSTGAWGARPSPNGLVQVPDVIGTPEAEARGLMEGMGLRVSGVARQLESFLPEEARASFHTVLPGHVLATIPRAGTRVSPEAGVRLNVRMEE